jgi:hypothetical protein
MKIIELFRSTNTVEGNKMLKGNFNELTWWSDNYETIEHYYDGSIIKIQVTLDKLKKQDYIVEYDDFYDPSNYTYGYAIMEYPKDAIWYSFSKKYLKENIRSIEEIDLKDLKSIFN